MIFGYDVFGAPALFNLEEDINKAGQKERKSEIDLCESVICSDLNREDHEDDEPLYDTSVQDCCGDCRKGYEEDDNGECQLNEGTPWILYGGLGLAGLACLLILKK